MTDDRKFEGVWIPKEIWLNPELSLIEKVLFVEIKSLDNINHCTKSNAKFAEFFNCSESTITRGVARLKNLGLIEELPFNGRFRRLKVNDEWVVKMTRQSSQNDEAGSSNCSPSNINSKLDSSKEDTNTKVLVAHPTGVQSHPSTKRSIPLVTVTSDTNTSSTPDNKNKKGNNENKKGNEGGRKKSLYEKCADYIRTFTEDTKLQGLLFTFLKYRLEVKDKALYFNQWKSMVDRLNDLADSAEDKCKIVQQSIDKGWLAFYEIKPIKTRGQQDPRVFSEYGIVKTGGDIKEVTDVQF